MKVTTASLICCLLLFFCVRENANNAIQQSNCYHEKGHEVDCEYALTSYMLFFGIIQIISSQISNFHSTKWLSVTATIMPFTYSLIGSRLGLAQAIGKVTDSHLQRYGNTNSHLQNTAGNGKIEGSIGGVPTEKPIQKEEVIPTCR
ncbi:hypothetical protein L1887_11643 [Cichorium endivia]|nr:hypothetical protein L1887_11643 [Cichorium endivia]